MTIENKKLPNYPISYFLNAINRLEQRMVDSKVDNVKLFALSWDISVDGSSSIHFDWINNSPGCPDEQKMLDIICGGPNETQLDFADLEELKKWLEQREVWEEPQDEFSIGTEPWENDEMVVTVDNQPVGCTLPTKDIAPISHWLKTAIKDITKIVR